MDKIDAGVEGFPQQLNEPLSKHLSIKIGIFEQTSE